MMLAELNPFAAKTAATLTPCADAIPETVSPDTTVYVDAACTGGAGVEGAASGLAVAPVRSRTWPGKIMLDQPSPLSARTDAVARPNLDAIPEIVSPDSTVY
jgi:hypothetical protein